MNSVKRNQGLENIADHKVARKLRLATGLARSALNLSTLVVGAMEGSAAANGRPTGWRADSALIIANTLFSGLNSYLQGYCRDFKVSDEEVDLVYERSVKLNPMTSIFPKSYIKRFLESSRRSIPQILVTEGATSTGRFFVGYGLGYLLTYSFKLVSPQ